MNRLTCWIVATALLSACGDGPAPGEGVIHGVNYVGVSVANLERSSEFYLQGAQLQSLDGVTAYPADLIHQLENSSEGPGSHPVRNERLLRSSNAQLRLMEFSSPADAQPVPVQGPGIAHICFQVNQETQTYERFIALGATPIGDRDLVHLNPKRPVFYGYAHDPDKNVIEIEHVDVSALDLETPPANDYRIRHVSLASPDINNIVAFYERLLGGQKARRVGRFLSLSGEPLDRISGLQDAKIKMAWLQTRNLELEFVQYTSHPTQRPAAPRKISSTGFNMIVFDVSDIDAARQLFEDAGGSMVSGTVPLDEGPIFFGRDPDGNLLGFQQTHQTAAVSSLNFKNNGL
ncbi:MAG: hypothetical protein Hals2KO_15700 [Halioglobus sp.]